jgi:hypothetical protein
MPMRTKLIALLTLAFGFALGACNESPVPQGAKRASPEDPVTQDIKQIEYGVRLAAANKRIDELERKVRALETTPEKLDLDLLTQRVTRLEVNSAGGEASVPKIKPTKNASQPVGGTRRESGVVRRPSATSPKLSLPELENRPRLATPAEAKAFSPEK